MATAMITPDLYRRVAAATDIERARPDLRGVRVEPLGADGVLLVATDARVLVAIRDPGGWCDEPMTARLDKHLTRMIGLKRTAAETMILVADDRAALVDRVGGDALDAESATIEMLDQMTSFGDRLRALQIRGARIDSDTGYPDWRSMIPTTFGGVASVDGRRLGRLTDAFFGPWEYPAMAMETAADGQSMVVRPLGSSIDGLGLIATNVRPAATEGIGELIRGWWASAAQREEAAP